jgi:tetratricopeptide (TPR) repeat protein
MTKRVALHLRVSVGEQTTANQRTELEAWAARCGPPHPSHDCVVDLIPSKEICGSSGLTIDHLGYDGDQSHKLPRNLTLLEKEVRVNPERMYLWWHLGTVYRDLGRIAEAEAAWQTGIDIARRVQPSPPEASLCFVELIRRRLDLGDDAMALLHEAIALHPEDPFLHWLMSQALMAAGRYEEALPIFERLAAIAPATLLLAATLKRERRGMKRKVRTIALRTRDRAGLLDDRAGGGVLALM